MINFILPRIFALSILGSILYSGWKILLQNGLSNRNIWKQIANTFSFEHPDSFQSNVIYSWIGNRMGGVCKHPFDVLTGTYEGVSIALYHLEVTLPKSGFDFTIAEIQCQHEMPHLLVTSPETFGILDTKGTEWLTMGKDFDDQLSVYVETHFEQEAYEILTPECMAWLVANKIDLNFELCGKTLYMYLSRMSFSVPAITALLDKAIAINKFLTPKLEEIEGDVKAMEETVATPEKVL